MPGAYLTIVCTGTVNGVSRTVQVSSKEYFDLGKFAIFTMNGLSTWKGSALEVSGDVGTDALLHFTASPTIDGSIYFYGSGAGFSGGTPSGYTTVRESSRADLADRQPDRQPDRFRRPRHIGHNQRQRQGQSAYRRKQHFGQRNVDRRQLLYYKSESDRQ